MKKGYVDEGGFIFTRSSSDRSYTEEIDDANGASLHERLVTQLVTNRLTPNFSAIV